MTSADVITMRPKDPDRIRSRVEHPRGSASVHSIDGTWGLFGQPPAGG